MKIRIWIKAVGMALLATAASAQPYLQPESHFLGIPGVDSVCTPWFLDVTDSSSIGFNHPWDLEVLKLSPTDYRVVFLDDINPALVVMPMDQQFGVPAGGLERTGSVPDDSIYDGTTLCRMQAGTYFNPATDHIAIGYWYGSRIGVYALDSTTNHFTLERTFAVPGVKRPVGLFWAFDQFFIADEKTQKIFRTDSQGNIISIYGHRGTSNDGYRWISNIDGYVDPSGTAHLYVSDGRNQRVDHLFAFPADPTIHLASQAVALPEDGLNYNTHEVSVIPGYGVVAFDRAIQRFYIWNRTDSLNLATRTCLQWEHPESPAIHMWDVCGRIVVPYISASDGLWSLRSYSLPGAPLDDPLRATFDHWTFDLSPIHLTETYHVIAGDTLIIDAGVEVLFDSAAALVVDSGAVLIVNGTAQNRVVFDAATSGQKWRGLRVYSDSPSNRLDYATISNAVNGVEVWNGQLSLNSTRIDHCRNYGAVYANSNGDWRRNDIRLCGRQGAFLISSEVSIDSCTVAQNTRAGLRLVGGDYNLLRSRINGNLCDPADTLRYLGAGVELLGAHLATTCDTIDHNDGPGLFVFAGSYTRLVRAWNRIVDNVQAYVPPMLDFGQISLVGGVAHLGDGFNTIAEPHCAQPPCNYRIRNLLIDSASVNLARNYWGDIDPQNLPPLLPPGALFDPALSAALNCGVLPQDTSGQPPDEVLFEQAYAAEQQGLFASAAQAYHLLWKDYPGSKLADAAVSRESFCQQAQGWTWSESYDYFKALADTATISDALRMQCDITAAWCLVGMGSFNDAETILRDLIDISTSEQELIEVQLHLFMTQLLENQDDSLLTALADKAPRRTASPRDTALVAFAQHLDDLVSAQLAGHGVKGQPAPTAAIPTRYALYQNYPNPFNPITEIRFDLPEAVNVELKIFNLLGQEVVTLVSAQKPAGAYTIAWDSKSAGGLPVSSGTYIYRLKAGNFVDAKRMTLLK